jgi:hypothetical protein
MLLAAASSLFAAATDYFPLQTGNSWVYRVTEGRIRDVQYINVEARETVESREYYRVDFFGRTVLLRADGDKLIVYDRDTKQEATFIDFGAPDGQSWNSAVDPCVQSGRIDSRAFEIKAPVGNFSNALAISYQTRCADAGINSQVFLPYVGLLRHTVSNISGPLQYDLSYSRTGATNLAVQQVSFAMALDKTVYPTGANNIEVRLTLRNSNPEPLKLTFPSQQSFDLKIYNERGDTAYVWSADKLFAQVVREIAVVGERTFAFKAEVPNLPAGKYVAEGFLTSQPKFSASVSFEVVPAARQ